MVQERWGRGRRGDFCRNNEKGEEQDGCKIDLGGRLPRSPCLIGAQDKAQLGPGAGCWCQFPEMAKLGESLDGGEKSQGTNGVAKAVPALASLVQWIE